MHETLQEFVDSRGVAVRVDRQRGIIRGVKILGLESRNGRVYLPEALRDAAPLYEGTKVNVNHPKGQPLAPRDYQDRIGVMRQVELREHDGLFGDFFFNPKHPLAEQLAWDAEHAPENVGFSHNVQARLARRGERHVVEAITRVQSVDLVADPATTQGLFESEISAANLTELLTTLTLEQLHATRGDLVQAILAEQSVEHCRLQAEIDRLTTAAAGWQKEQLVRRLLREFALPEPEARDAWSRTIISEAFYAGLISAPDETALRRLIEDRARLVQQAAQSQPGRRAIAPKPQCRDQHTLEALPVHGNARQFVLSIT